MVSSVKCKVWPVLVAASAAVGLAAVTASFGKPPTQAPAADKATAQKPVAVQPVAPAPQKPDPVVNLTKIDHTNHASTGAVQPHSAKAVPANTASAAPRGTKYAPGKNLHPVVDDGVLRDPPPNDDCSSAIAIPLATATPGTTVGATADSATTPVCGTVINPGVWYTVVGNGHNLRANLCGSSYDTMVNVFTGTCGALVCVGGDDDSSCGLQSQFQFPSTNGTTYFVFVQGFGGATGTFTLTVEDLGGGGPVANDECANATPIAIGGTASGDTTSATAESIAPPDCAFTGLAPGVWYTVVGNGDVLEANGCASSYDQVIDIYTGTCGALTCTAAGDDTCGIFAGPATAQWNSVNGTTYYIFVNGFGGSTGAYSLTVNDLGPPCTVTIPGGAIPENEPDCGLDVDTVNGGCNSSPNVFSNINVGDTISGTAGFDGNFRDTDWYQVTIASGTQLTWTATAEFDVVVGIIYAGCPANIVPGTFIAGGPCAPLSTTACLNPGTYYMFVAPNFTNIFACGGHYVATLSGVPCSPPPPPANDDCANAIALAIGGSDSGDTSTATVDIPAPPDCAFTGLAPGVWYTVVGNGDILEANGCASGYDQVIDVYTGTCGAFTCAGSDDDGCGIFAGPSTAQWASQNGVTYYIFVNGFGGSTGAYSITINDLGPPCTVTIPGGAIAENEPDCGVPVDSVNGGCNSTPNVFSPINVGDTVSGTGTFDGGTRDTDWYQVTIASGTQLTWTATAEFDVVVGMVFAGCPANIVPNTFIAGGPCAPLSTSACLNPGTYYMFVAPNFTHVFPCGGNNHYFATLTGVPCSPPPPPANDDCGTAAALAIPSTVSGDTTTAGVDAAVACGTSGVGPGVWYTFPGIGQTVTLTLCGSTYDTMIEVYSGTCANLTCVTGNDDSTCGGAFTLQSTVSFCAHAGTTYYVLVTGFGGGSGPFTLQATTDGANCDPVPTGKCCVAGTCSVTTQAGCSGAWTQGGNCLSVGASHTYTSNPNLAIPDAQCPNMVSDTINVADGYNVADVNVQVTIPDHTFIGDLFINLVHGATTVNLWNHQCGGNDGLNVTFDDQGAAVFCAQPTTGTVLPFAPLSAFNGASVNGAWTLQVCDGAGADIGTLTTWSLIASEPGAPACGCAADYDHNGHVEPADIAAFVNTWFASLQSHTLDGDWDHNGAVEPADIAAFVNDWFHALQFGC